MPGRTILGTKSGIPMSKAQELALKQMDAADKASKRKGSFLSTILGAFKADTKPDAKK